MKKTLLATTTSLLLSGLFFSVNAADLSTVYQLAEQNDPTVQAERARFQAVETTIDSAESALLPNLTGSVGYNTNRGSNIDGTSRNTSAGISLSQQIYHHDTWQTLDKTELNVKQSQFGLQSVEQNLIVRTVSAYLEALKAKDDLEFVIAEKKAIERQLEQTKQRFAVGLTAITDVHEAQAQFDNAVAEEISALNQVEASLEGLREITGEYHADINMLNKETFGASMPAPESVDGWLKIAELQNRQLQAQKIAKNVAKLDIDISESGHLPTADLNASYGYQQVNPGEIDSNSLSVGISVSVPIYTGGRLSAGVEQAQHNFVAASQSLEKQHREVVRQVRNAFNNVKSTISRIKAFEQSVVSAESALKATEAGFEVGTRTIVDVLNSTRNLYNAKRNLANARYTYINSVLQLKFAAGNISEVDIDQINRGLSAS